MSSGITQLLAVGAQDEHLVGRPEVSYFRSTYNRHSNFAHSVEQQVIRGNVKNGGTSTVRFDRLGDLLSYVYLTIDTGTSSEGSFDWTELIHTTELLVGGQVIDTQDSYFTERIAIDALAQNMSKSSNGVHPGSSGVYSYFYPLRFSFFENWQSSMPLVALQYHDVEIRITWGAAAEDHQWKCWGDFIYLDTPERSRFASKPISMLMTQVQRVPGSDSKVQELIFNHPIKFIASSNTSPDSALTSTNNRIKLQINGVDLSVFKYARPNFVDVPAYYHTHFVTSPDTFLYSFGLNTSSYQPSGSLNFSRLDSARIVSETINLVDPVYAVNYNILHIEHGMGGLMYMN
jgi:hypothetical protein